MGDESAFFLCDFVAYVRPLSDQLMKWYEGQAEDVQGALLYGSHGTGRGLDAVSSMML